MKTLTAILSCLLLVAAQCVSLGVPASSQEARGSVSGCCGDHCSCRVNSDAGNALPLSDAVAVSGVAFPLHWTPPAHNLFHIGPAPGTPTLRNADTLQAAPSRPLFRLQCALLI